MKHTFTSERKVRLVGDPFYTDPTYAGTTPVKFSALHEITIEGKSLQNVVDKLLTDPTYLNVYVESAKSLKFVVYQYDEVKINSQASKWNQIEPSEPQTNALHSNVFKDSWSVSPEWTHLYFNQKIIANSETVEAMIKKHKKYKEALKLREQVENEAKINAEREREEQKRIREENDIWTLANLMKKHSKKFNNILKQAKDKIEETSLETAEASSDPAIFAENKSDQK